jgi:hypothetical protein
MNLASMLRKIVLPHNMAPQLFPQIFLGADTKICGKNVLGGLAILCVRNGMLSARKIVPHYLADPGILYVKPQLRVRNFLYGLLTASEKVDLRSARAESSFKATCL